ncbi:GAF domain-containing protein, partial [Jatrophihabitans endophyticus]|uniref:GAF domain-containing protein n=1 Tax=Jatrophihabitans endophyticus TaxID=1206085 RepID=UPI0019E6BA91
MTDRPSSTEAKRSIESLQQIARLAHRLTGAAGVTLSLFEHGTQHVIGAAGDAAAAYAGAKQPADLSLCGLVVQTGQPLVCDDTHSDPDVRDHSAVVEGGV